MKNLSHSRSRGNRPLPSRQLSPRSRRTDRCPATLTLRGSLSCVKSAKAGRRRRVPATAMQPQPQRRQQLIPSCRILVRPSRCSSWTEITKWFNTSAVIRTAIVRSFSRLYQAASHHKSHLPLCRRGSNVPKRSSATSWVRISSVTCHRLTLASTLYSAYPIRQTLPLPCAPKDSSKCSLAVLRSSKNRQPLYYHRRSSHLHHPPLRLPLRHRPRR